MIKITHLILSSEELLYFWYHPFPTFEMIPSPAEKLLRTPNYIQRNVTVVRTVQWHMLARTYLLLMGGLLVKYTSHTAIHTKYAPVCVCVCQSEKVGKSMSHYWLLLKPH